LTETQPDRDNICWSLF